jgi:SAM-dependent methyltransferase
VSVAVSTESPIVGPRCPSCVGALQSAGSSRYRCESCGNDYAEGPYPRTLAFSEVGANFAQPLDAEIVPRLIPALDALDPPECSERVILRAAEELGIPIGNPVWEGRADLARLLLAGRDTVALDIGCGFGTFATAIARSAGHVFATDRSPVRVALTGARARAEALDNVTAFETNGVSLPLGDDLCDLVTVIGVLEWAGVGTGDAPAAQRAMLAEVHRVLKPGGVLLLGIENRYAAHYFLGAREDHTNLRFSSLLPRRLANLQSRRARGAPFETPTHSRSALKRLLREAGLAPRVAVVLPSYQQARFAFDEADARAGLRFYVRHAFHASSTARRLAGRALLLAPADRVVALLPSFWGIAAKGVSPPPPIPGMITGSPYCDGAIKAIDWAGRVTATSRLSGEPLRSEVLVDGWNARRWVAWPLRPSAREGRRRRLLGEIEQHLREAMLGVEPASGREAASQALAALGALSETVSVGAIDRCRETLAAVPDDVPQYREHGDLILNNMVVDSGGSVTLVDRPAREASAPVGRDVTIAALDLLCIEAGEKQLDLGTGLLGLERVGGREAAAVTGLLRTAFGGLPVEQVEALMLAGVLRHCAEQGTISGVQAFLEKVAKGQLARALAALGIASPRVVAA